MYEVVTTFMEVTDMTKLKTLKVIYQK